MKHLENKTNQCQSVLKIINPIGIQKGQNRRTEIARKCTNQDSDKDFFLRPPPFKRILTPDVINHKYNLTSYFPQFPLGLFPHLQSEDMRFKEESKVRVSNLKWTSEVKGVIKTEIRLQELHKHLI